MTFSYIAAALTANITEWKKRNVYQLLTDRFAIGNGSRPDCPDLKQYCGGNFEGITKNLQYIKDLGFDAVWISPVVDNTELGYHGYWAKDWNKINQFFGDERSLKNLVNTAHSMDILVMVDVVANHVGPVEKNFTLISPFDKEIYYHKFCDIVDWTNQTEKELCRLFSLPDLNQSNPLTKQILNNWIQTLVNRYGFDGIRIDTVLHVQKDFWPDFVSAAGVFQMGEVSNENDTYVGEYQQSCVNATFNYPMYYTIKDVFIKGYSMANITSRWASQEKAFKDIDSLGIFVDNHDNPRFLNQTAEIEMFKNALTFAQTSRGIPFFYYGSEQAFTGGGDPNNREPFWNSFNTQSEMYKFTKTLNQARKASQIWSFEQKTLISQDSVYAYTRGKFLVILTNQPEGTIKVDINKSDFDVNETVCNIFDSSDCIVAGDQGKLSIQLDNGVGKVYIPETSELFNGLRNESFSNDSFIQQ